LSQVLITGGAGFIGSHLAARLIDLGHHVHLADSFQRGARDRFLHRLLDRGATLVEVDLCSPGAVEQSSRDFDHIYHLAAIVGVANVARAPYQVLDQNTAMLSAAIRIAQRQRALSRFCFTSTSEIYAGTLAAGGLTFPTPETSPLVLPNLASPRTSYMLSKIYGEAMCKASGLPTTIFRPHNIYGPRMGTAHVIPELLQRAYRASDGDRLEVYSVDHQRTFCYIDDAVELIRLAAEAPCGDGATLNIGNEAPEVTIGALAELVVDTVGRKLEIVPLPATAGSPTRRVPDTSQVRQLTGYNPAVSLEEGVHRTFSWYRESLFDAAD
jgi:nucleoside-diphosphate-sugar epimerase